MGAVCQGRSKTHPSAPLLRDVRAPAAAARAAPALRGVPDGRARMTVELAHEPGEEIQLDWLELSETPWGEPAYVLVGALSFSGRCRGVISEGMTFAHLVEGSSASCAASPRQPAEPRGRTAWRPSWSRGMDRVMRSFRRSPPRRRGVDLSAAPPAAQG